jgi:hypothetical protein
MAVSSLSTVAYIYKKNYAGEIVGDLAARKHPFYFKLKKNDGFTGRSFDYPIAVGNPQGIGANFAAAQAAVATSQGFQLVATRKKKYGFIQLDGESILAAGDDRGAFVKLVRNETDRQLEEFGDHLAFDLYRDGGGVRGVRLGALVGNTVTMTTAGDARNFKIGMTVTAGSAADGSGMRVGTTTVAGVSEQANTVTLTNAGAIAAFAAGDFLWASGDQPVAGNQCVNGLAAHLPLTAPTAGDSFNSIDRSVDPVRLAGVRVNNTANYLEENIYDACVQIYDIGKTADTAFCNPVAFGQMVKRMNAKVMYQEAGGTVKAYFRYINLDTPAGLIECYPDPDCPRNRSYVTKMDTWFLKHVGGAPHIIMDDDMRSLRTSNADSIESRTRFLGDLICKEPGSNAVIAVA